MSLDGLLLRRAAVDFPSGLNPQLDRVRAPILSPVLISHFATSRRQTRELLTGSGTRAHPVPGGAQTPSENPNHRTAVQRKPHLCQSLAP